MTRINAGIHPKRLHRRHLIAEYRELPMVPAALRRSLRTATPAEVVARIPKTFTLGKGHVLFFFDKLRYLQRRYAALQREMIRRGYQPDESRDPGFGGRIPPRFFGDWKETVSAEEIVRKRIAARIAEKPHLYKEGRVIWKT